MIDQLKAFERQYTTTNSDLTTTITAAAATCLKSFDARNARLEHEKLRDPNNVNRRRHHRQIEQKKEANVTVLKNTN
jgi:hypothetical protein